MGGRDTGERARRMDGRVRPRGDGALHSVAAVTSSESSAGISAAPLNTSRGEMSALPPDNCQRQEADGVTGGENKEGTAAKRW